MYAKDLSEPKYQYLIKKRENAEIKHLKDPNALVECQIRWMAFIRILTYSGWGEGKKAPASSFSPVTSTNVRIRPQNFLNFSFNPFDILV